MPFSTRVKRSFISSGWLADDDGAGDVGGAVLILAAGIDEEDLIDLERQAIIGVHVVMGNGGVGAGAGDAVEGKIEQHAGVPARIAAASRPRTIR